MGSSTTSEVLYITFKYKVDTKRSEINYFLEEQFVDAFVEKNGWCCAGGGMHMSLYDDDGDTNVEELKTALITFINQSVPIVDSLLISDFDEESEEFIDKETVEFS